MKALCRCLPRLGARKDPNDEYGPVDGTQVGKVLDDDDEDEDDFFGDDWGAGGAEKSSPLALEVPAVKSQGVERNPTRETTTKRGSTPTAAPAPAAAAAPAPKAGGKKETDFFGEMGMEIDYKAPRVRDTSKADPGRSVTSLLEDGDTEAVGAWGDDDLDLNL